jgi:protein ImuA
MPADLAILRRKVAAIETGGRQAAALPTGAADLDSCLPGGGLAWGALHEALPDAPFDTPAAAAFLIALATRAAAARPGAVVWIAPRAGFDMGALYGPGLAAFGLDPRRVIILAAPDGAGALWAGEEALGDQGVAALILVQPKPLSMAAGRRLHLAGAAGGALGLLLSPPGSGGANVARSRWVIAARASRRPDWAVGKAGLAPPGAPAWRADLVRAPGARPQSFDLEWRHATRSLHLASVLEHQSVAPTRSHSAA